MMRVLVLTLLVLCSVGTAYAVDPVTHKSPNSIRPLADTNGEWECRKDNDGRTRCRCIRNCLSGTEGWVELTIENLDEFDLPELLALSRVLKTGEPAPILRDFFGPITECGNGHGQSACCQIISKGGNFTYISCPVFTPPPRPIANAQPVTDACAMQPPGGSCCHYDPNDEDGLGAINCH